MRHPRTRSRLLSILAAVCILATAGPAPASAGQPEDSPSGGLMLLDVVALRPLGVLATALGAVTFVVSLPFSGIGGNAPEAAEKLVMQPLRFTFLRPLGHVE